MKINIKRLKESVRDGARRSRDFLIRQWQAAKKAEILPDRRDAFLLTALAFLAAGITMQFTLGWAFIVLGVVLCYIAIKGVS